MTEKTPNACHLIFHLRMSRRASSRKQRPFMPKNKFSSADDDLLRALVKELGTKDWRNVAKRMPGRNPRQCRERWMNYANPEIKKRPWTPEEDALLQTKYDEMGPRWHPLASLFPHRSINQIKNRIATLQRHMNKLKTMYSDYDEYSDMDSEPMSPVIQAPCHVREREPEIIEQPAPPKVEMNPFSFLDTCIESTEIDWITDESSPFQTFDFFTNSLPFF